ncbi:MAG: phosphoribosylformylglycinamidine synthase [Bacillota bacterium]|nr:phosphoribosylformylglycinamidine synthase [Bacillota bacterium]
MVYRIYVEKKPGFNVEAGGMLADLRDNLHLQGLEEVRILNRYDVEGIDRETYERSKGTVFSEPAIDRVFEEELPRDLGSVCFAVEYLPGQYDQRADSAAQCIKMMAAGGEPVVKCARVIGLKGCVSPEELAAVKKYCINPVDSREASPEKPQSLSLDSPAPADVALLQGFRSMGEEEGAAYRRDMGLAMSMADLRFVQKYFAEEEKRDPTLTELRVIDTYWSDHCRHTTFQTKLSQVDFEASPYGELVRRAFGEYLELRRQVYGNKEKDVCLMDVACIGAKYLKGQGLVPDLDESDEINACSIKVKAMVDGQEQDWLVMFKNETHNHPTEIEPFGGAATCLGGAIRDPLSGRVYVYQAMRVTGAADPRTPVAETMAGKLPQRKITREAAAGYSSYGNQIGLATGLVNEIYHPGYVAKRMEVGAVIGAAPADHVRRGKPRPGDVILLVGGRTGRDGCGGATGSSKEHTEESILTCGAEVQKGNPPVERNIQRLFRRKEAACLIKKCNDFGAGGVSVAVGELADSIDVNLDLVPRKYEGLDGTELAISESQERMAVMVAPEDAEAFIAYAGEENLEALAVARVTDSGRFRMFWREKCILDLSREFLNTNGVKQETAVFVKGEAGQEAQGSPIGDKPLAELTEEGLLALLSDLNVCSQKGLIERFDSTIGGATVLMPLGGKYQLSPAAGMAAKLPVTEGETDTATLMAYGFDPYLSSASPFHGALYAVLDSVTKIAAMGGDISRVRMSFQEYFQRLGAPESWGRPLAALLGALKAQKELGLPSIGGKDSMSGTFMDINVPPTLISFAVGVTEASAVVSQEFKKPGSALVLLAPGRDTEGLPDFGEYKKAMARVRELAVAGKLLSAGTIGKGGLFAAAVKMAAGNGLGLSLEGVAEGELTAENYGALLLEFENRQEAAALLKGLPFRAVGSTEEEKRVRIRTAEGRELSVSMEKALKAWVSPLESVFPATAPAGASLQPAGLKVPDWTARREKGPVLKTPRPRVLIPVFPGTNCEMDSKRAFEKAGAEGKLHIIRNLTRPELTESIGSLAAEIGQSQIIMLPGGFSGGDEPDGSAKFITAVFRNPQVREAVEGFLERGGLMLGVCNGFQALIKLGLVPFGKILDADESFPTLTYNTIGRHMSCLVRTRVASVKSPWLAAAEVGDVHTVAISHGEGRFIASEALLRELAASGQIVTQYVDEEGLPGADMPANPNGSMLAAEGIVSPDGRILGKMGHSERAGVNVFKNVEGNKDQGLFASGVAYFR